MELGPSFYQTPFLLRETAAQDLKGIDGEDCFIILIVGMEVRAVVWSAWLSVHADDDTEEATDLGHAFFLNPILLQSPMVFARRANGMRYPLVCLDRLDNQVGRDEADLTGFV
jgi:hypothetical protein